MVSTTFGVRHFRRRGMKPVLPIAGLVVAAGFYCMSLTVGSLDKGLLSNTLWLSLDMVATSAGIGFMLSPSSKLSSNSIGC